MEQDQQSQPTYPEQPAHASGPGPYYPPTAQHPPVAQNQPVAQNPPIYGMGITAHALRQLATARKWAFFLAITGFIGCGFMVLGGVFFGLSIGLVSEYFPGGGMLDQGPAVAAALMYIVLAAVYFFPAFFLLRFSLRTKHALAAHSPDLITDALRNLKLFFAYVGILVIVGLALSLIAILVVMVTAVTLQTPFGV